MPSDIQTPRTERLVDQPWEAVELTLTYQDGARVQTRSSVIVRAEVEADERAAALQNFEEQLRGLSPEQVEESAAEIEQARAAAEGHTLSDGEFKRRILENADHMLQSSLKVQDANSNTIRILPPWAIRQVAIEVKNLRPILTL